jgi:hypothetical protein
MSVDKSTRALVAILAADIVSYTVRREAMSASSPSGAPCPLQVNWALARLTR